MYYNHGEYPRAWRALQRAERWGGEAPPEFIDTLAEAMREPRNPGLAHGM